MVSAVYAMLLLSTDSAVESSSNDGMAKHGDLRIESACFMCTFIDVNLAIVLPQLSSNVDSKLRIQSTLSTCQNSSDLSLQIAPTLNLDGMCPT